MRLTKRSYIWDIVARRIELGIASKLEILWYMKGCDSDTEEEEEQLKLELLQDLKQHEANLEKKRQLQKK